MIHGIQSIYAYGSNSTAAYPSGNPPITFPLSGGYGDASNATAVFAAPPGAPLADAVPSWIIIAPISGGATSMGQIEIRPPSFPTAATTITFWVKYSLAGYPDLYDKFQFIYGVSSYSGGTRPIPTFPGGGFYQAEQGLLIGATNVGHWYGSDGVQRTALLGANGTTATAVAGQAFSFFVNIDTSVTSFTANGEKPSWVNIGTNPAMYGTAKVFTGTAPGTPGLYGFNVTASDGTYIDDCRVFIWVKPPPAPVVSASKGSCVLGSALAFNITGTNGPTSYGAVGLPAGLALDASTGHVTGSPTVAGTFSVTLSATNAGGTGSAPWTLTITLPPVPVLDNDDATGTVGTAFLYQVVASGSPSSYGASNLPAGLTFNAATGVVGGVPTTVGESNVTLSATNLGGAATQVVVFTIAAAPVVDPGTGGGDASTGKEAYPFAFVQIDLVTGKITAQAGALAANHGDAIIFQVQFGPAEFVGTVQTPTFIIKEKGEIPQFLSLLSGGGATSPDGINFLFPALGISGPDLDASLRLLDGIEPSTVVTYSLQFRYIWNGRSRSSQIVDFPITRDLAFLPAVGAGTTSGAYVPGGGTTSAPATIIVVSAPLAASPTSNVGQNVTYGCVIDGAMSLFQLKYGTFPNADAAAAPDDYVQPADYSPTNQRYWLKVL